MSKAGTYSNQGDDYQRAVAIHWMIQLISDESIEYMQAESNGLVTDSEKVTVDDIVIAYKNGNRKHIQAKKNQTQAREWSISDWGSELKKIREQLDQGEHINVELYSSTPLGLFTTLPEESRIQPNLTAFKNGLSKEKQAGLEQLSKRWERSEEEIFHLLRRITTGSHHNINDWRNTNNIALQHLVTQPSMAMDALESFLNRHQSKDLGSKFEIRSQEIQELFANKGLTLLPKYTQQQILDQFKRTSAIGRNDWKRMIAGKKIHRTELDDIITHIENKKSTIIVEDRPGSGKTCLLLDLADKIETNSNLNLLFIKGDRFTDAVTEDESLPKEIVEGCGLLSETTHVIVIIDSLDVLSGLRDHTSLNYFLKLIDQLQIIQNVTVIAACREFDLKYDPKLRDRKWDSEIKLADFDFEQTVVPILNDL